MTEAIGHFRVPRTCTRKSDKADETGSHPLEHYRGLPAYVLLGDPGAGKTEAFKSEAAACGGAYVKARDFAIFDPKPEYRTQILFIDGLDEMRAGGGDGRTPLDHVRKHLERLGCPRFRVSCREADWLGDSDSAAIAQVSPDGKVVALHLDPLTDGDVVAILRHKAAVSDPDEFVRRAGEHRLDELLRNPQTLNLLVAATGGNEWPQSREQIYDLACRQLVGEKNPEHRQAKRDKAYAPETLLDAAGYLCAIHLLSGIAGFALDEDATDTQHYNWNELAGHSLPLLPVLKSNLFQYDGEEQRIPVHRGVAEYLGARYLAKQIEHGGLPLGRVLVLMTGEDGGVVPDLRGLAAWLSVHSRSGRPVLIERDPLGVVLYGDVRNFPVADKLLVLAGLKNQARQYPWFRSEDWSSSPFGALGTADMMPAFREILSSPSREEADQTLLDCVLDALRHGERMSALADLLECVVRDATHWPRIRTNAVEALLHAVPEDAARLLKLAEDIRGGGTEDRDDEILGVLLHKLYPHFISPVQILDYLHPPKDRNLIGTYGMFWDSELPDATPKEDIPTLLDQLGERCAALREVPYEHEHRINGLAGKLLARGLEAHGDAIPDERLYAWLGAGLDEYEYTRPERGQAEKIARWLEDRPGRYKAVIDHGASRCMDQENIWYCMSRCTMRLHGATPPPDIKSWYLEKAITEQQGQLGEYYLVQAVRSLIDEGGQQGLMLAALEEIESWLDAHPSFREWLLPFITCPVGDWQQEQALHNQERKIGLQKRKAGWIGNYRQHLAAIREGTAYPQILHDLALAYNGAIRDVHGETPDERLADFLDGDQELIAAAHAGFRHVLERNDLPSVQEIVDLELKGKMHYIRPACLVGMDELCRCDPSHAMRLDDGVLRKLLAFRLGYDAGENPAWLDALIRERPALVAEVLVARALPLLRAGKEHVSGLRSLAYDEAYSEVARLALPPLLEGFPLRARKHQLGNALDPLLKGALRYLDKAALAAIVARKLGLGSMDSAQRVYWLACGLILAPEAYAAKLFEYVGTSKARSGHLAGFLHDHWERGFSYGSLPETTLSLLIELLAPDCSPIRPVGSFRVASEMNTADLLRSFINTLSSKPGETAPRELERLLALPRLAHWHNELRGALHSQRVARRKATFRRLGVAEVDRTLANLQPAGAADLAALTFAHLRDIARKIRDGGTNDYKQYWSYDESNEKLDKPKPENDCRDALLSDLNERLGKQGIDAQREGSYADDKRADIRVSFGGANGFNVPVEIKKDGHADLWRAIHEQLIPKYVRDPGADGHGIYLVFWFGGKGMPLPSDGKKIRSAEELESRLRQTIAPEESHRIQVCVIDCALP